MRQILELIPLILFFVAYKMDGETLTLFGYGYQFDGIFSATFRTVHGITPGRLVLRTGLAHVVC